jgi:hypothetical protein
VERKGFRADYIIMDETFSFNEKTGLWTVGHTVGEDGVIAPGLSAIYRCKACPCPESSHKNDGVCVLHGPICLVGIE